MAVDAYFKELEKIIKGFANHRRLQILDLLRREPWLSIDNMCEKLNIGYHNASDHVRKMSIAGLVVKRNEGVVVKHKLTPLAESILVFCKKLK